MQVRIHGTTDYDKLKEATIRFLKAVENHRKKARNEKRKETVVESAQGA